jgi:hypothetical protein
MIEGFGFEGINVDKIRLFSHELYKTLSKKAGILR